ncbi:hypothetical protein AM588_10006372 [Phytophthora nicotianae]|uniref:Glutaredoxin 2 C-terminal domain-containing protein n=1 Tax=Phytophthora nicotianae TaxID=4792 RepID=A0A0W8D8F8_PHYNI|nr:hypothetical protein AM588_10006372 [Phytophthora nicotianae]
MSTPALSGQPQLYIYDHCPFCCRARVALGLKKVKYDVLFLASHDEATPIGLVGSKQAPIFVPVGEKPFPESWDVVNENLAKSPEIVKQVNQLLKELELMLHSNHSVNAELSYDDLDLFGRLRGLTLVKGVEWPTKVREFLEYFSEAGDVPLYDNVVKI